MMIRADNAVVRFWIFALGQFFIWIVVPSIVFRNLPLDVVEGLGWGHGWPSGTYKHPPLQAWILELAAIIGGRHDSAIYAAGAGSLLLTYWALWRFGRMVVAPPVALVGVMALASCFYFATTIPEFNPNVVQMPLYVLCGWLFWRGVQNDRLYDWLLFGFCAGLGMLGKYSFAFMLLSIGGFILIDAKARAALRRPGPYLALIVGVAVFAPHFAWMVQHNWLPLHYAQSRTHYADGIVMALAQAAKFFLGQMLAIFPVLLVLWLARTRSGSGVQLAKDASLRRYLTFLAWGPVALIVLLSAVTGAQMRDMWGMGLWVFIGLWAAERWRSDWDRSALARGVLLLAMLAMPVAVWLGASHSVSFGFRPWRTEFPGRQLAAEAEAFWREQTRGTPLKIVLGDSWYGGNIAWYAPSIRPQLMINGNAAYSPWVAYADVARHGALAVWDPDGGGAATPDWALRLGQITAIKTVTLPYGNKQIRARLAVVGRKAQ